MRRLVVVAGLAAVAFVAVSLLTDAVKSLRFEHLDGRRVAIGLAR